MSDWQAGRWLAGDGRWRLGQPPPGWWMADNGRWYPPQVGDVVPTGQQAQSPPTEPPPTQHVSGTEPSPTQGVPESEPPMEGVPETERPLTGANPSWASQPTGTSEMHSWTPVAPRPGRRPADPWAAFMSWPLGARIAAVAGAVFLCLVVVGVALAEPEEQVETSSSSSTSEQTTTTARRTTTTAATTTTEPPTTTTAPPPPTTQPPPPTTAPPPPTTAPPPPPPTVAPAPASNCHPSYSPCVPYASDVDCEGGSGDGPVYTGPVQVTGSDPYGLDNDGDGAGCE
jgi:hypothetical protein